MEERVRSLMKAISFRIVATSITILLVFLFTGNVVASAGVGSIDFLAKLGIYYLHERMWNTSNFGRKESKLA